MKKITFLTVMLTMISVFMYGQDPYPNVDPSSINHWTGSGTNKAILVVCFYGDDPDIGYAWGYQWDNGSTMYVSQMLTDIDN
ncbi:MAG: hypothetical protein LBQ64_05415, partial [Bacteroidales bacterium]|nr:hypothetical protein [Bacteroidales bacterium]